MNFKKIALFLFAMINTATVFSQSQTYTNIRQVKLNNVDAIIENKQVVGYYVFFFKDKVNRKESAYELALLDVNLTPTHSVEMVKPKNTYLLEGAYNGNTFCFSFINMKEKTVEYQIIDKKAKIVGSYIKSDLSNSEIQQYMQAVASEEDTYAGGLLSLEGKGFVRFGMEREKGVRYEIELIDDKGQKVWTATSGTTTKKSFESATAFYADKDAIVSLVTIKEKALSGEADFHLLFTNPNDGKDMFKVPTEHASGYLVPMGINHDTESKNYIVYGEYYGKKGSKDKFDPNNKIGFFMMSIDGTGKVLEEHFVDWNRDISKLVPLNKKGRMDGNNTLFIHNLVKTADGKYFIIGEQYKKSASALGIANAALGGDNNVSTVRADLHDMIVFEFNSKFEPVKMNIVEKDKVKILLPRGAGILPMNALGQYLKACRAFDYSFTFISDGGKTFQSSYVNYDREKGDSKYVIGNIVYNKKGELVTDQIPLTSKPTIFAVLPGKPGYIFIFEYFRKKKEIVVRLEKMDI